MSANRSPTPGSVVVRERENDPDNRTYASVARARRGIDMEEEAGELPPARAMITAFHLPPGRQDFTPFRVKRGGPDPTLQVFPLGYLRSYVGTELQRICIWGDESTTPVFRHRLARVVQVDNLLKFLVKCDRVTQPGNGRVRFDLYIDMDVSVSWLLRIRRIGRSWGWHAKIHIPWTERNAQRGVGVGVGVGDEQFNGRAARPRAAGANEHPGVNGDWTEVRPRSRGGHARQRASTCTGPLRIGTYNIHGLRTKKEGVTEFLAREKISILAIQETLQTPADFDVRIMNYNVFGTTGENCSATRGVALLVEKDLSVMTLHSDPNFLFAKVYGRRLKDPIIFGTVYVPCVILRQRVLSKLVDTLGRIHRDHPECPVFVMGDFNMGFDDIQELVLTWPAGAKVMRNTRSSQEERSTHKRGSTLDYIAVMGEDSDCICSVRHRYDLSDHYPVVAEIPNVVGPAAPKVVGEGNRWEKVHLTSETVVARQNRERIASHNHWEILGKEFEDLEEEDMDEDWEVRSDAVDRLASRLCMVSHQVAEDLKFRQRKRSSRGSRQPAVIRRAIKKRRRLAKKLRRGRDLEPEARLDIRRRHEHAVNRAKRLCKETRLKRWRRTLKVGYHNMVSNPRQHWRWASGMGGWKGKNHLMGIQPIRHHGEMQLELESILEAWRWHYAELAKDPTGNSQSPEKWLVDFPVEDDLDPLPGLNDLLTIEEVWLTLSRGKGNKAPGMDGIPLDFQMSALVEEARLREYNGRRGMNELLVDANGDVETEPEAPFTKILLNMLQMVWTSGHIPKDWEDSIVVSIPKKGDLADMDNYRGISLMNTTLKMLTMILAARISRSAETAERFSKAQAGFRSLEEAVTQAGCVMECVQRRRIRGERTLCLFIDFKKAYDRVPHQGLFRKLRRFGISGRMLQFLQSLYAKSFIRVRVGSGPNTAMTERFQLLRGVRQGCPLSPVLFNIYINDLWEEEGLPALQVPTGRSKDRTVVDITGSLFADDAAGLVKDVEDLSVYCNHVTAWGDRHEMDVSPLKCGILEFPPFVRVTNSGKTELGPSTLRRDESRFKIQGGTIPVVDAYEYLGLTLTSELDRDAIIRARLSKQTKTIFSLKPFFTNKMLPLSMRVNVLRSVVLPRLLYGAEIYGMCRFATNLAQSRLNIAMRMIVGVNAVSASLPLWMELGIRPICAIAAGRRARALLKCRMLRSWVQDLERLPFISRRWTWLNGAISWMHRHSGVEQWEFVEDPRLLKKAVEDRIASRETEIRLRDGRMHSETTRFYVNADFTATRLWSASTGFDVRLQVGYILLLRARINMLYLGPQLAAAGKIPERYSEVCPCCRLRFDGGETMEHLFLECQRWERHRGEILGPVLELARSQAVIMIRSGKSHFQSEASTVLALLLGGRAGGKVLKNWLFSRCHVTVPSEEETDDDASASSSDSSSDSTVASDTSTVFSGASDTSEEITLGSARVARFLMSVVAARADIIMGTIPDRQGLFFVSRYGIPLYTPGQRPVGYDRRQQPRLGDG
jgi:exonuclease III